MTDDPMPTPDSILSDRLRDAAFDRDGEVGDKLLLDAADAIDRLTAAQSVPQWQPIKTAPKDGTRIDLLVDGKRRRTNCNWADKWGMWWWHDGSHGDGYDSGKPITDTVTHWMPLTAAPSPPAEGEGE